MSNYIGTKEITKIYLGSTEIKKLYVGEEPVWDGGDEGGGIDEYTVLCHHLNENTANSSQYTVSSDTPSSATLNYMDGKFGKAGDRWIHSDNGFLSEFSFPQEATIDNSCTLDYWQYFSSDSDIYSFGRIEIESGNIYSFVLRNNEAQLIVPSNPTINFSSSSNPDKWTELLSLLKNNNWNHIAYQIENSIYIKIFINGTLFYSMTDTQHAAGYFSNFPIYYFKMYGENTYGNYCRFDEIRLSKVARYSGDFTPPTQPYSN